MLYSLEMTKEFAALQKPPAALEGVAKTLIDEHFGRNLTKYPGINGTVGIRPEKYAENKVPTPSAVDLAFAAKGSSPKIVLSEMKFECRSVKKIEALVYDIVNKVNGTKGLFTQDIPFHSNVYVLVDDAQQQVLSRLQKEFAGKRNPSYRVCLLQDLYNEFFVDR